MNCFLAESTVWWSAALGALVGGVISLASTVGVAVFTDYSKQNRERKRTAALAAAGFFAVLKHLQDSQVAAALLLLKRNAMLPSPREFVFPIRGSFLRAVSSVEPSLSLLPRELMQRTARHNVLLRGLVEDFQTLAKIQTKDLEQFCDVLIEKVTVCEAELPLLVEDLLKEARVSRDTLSDSVTD
jgi:hypothetical protein